MLVVLSEWNPTQVWHVSWWVKPNCYVIKSLFDLSQSLSGCGVCWDICAWKHTYTQTQVLCICPCSQSGRSGMLPLICQSQWSQPIVLVEHLNSRFSSHFAVIITSTLLEMLSTISWNCGFGDFPHLDRRSVESSGTGVWTSPTSCLHGLYFVYGDIMHLLYGNWIPLKEIVMRPHTQKTWDTWLCASKAHTCM